jgi:1-acyl-sn-glycerol-3-phosphate acyltransferase
MKRWYFLSPFLLQKLIWVPTRLLLFGLAGFRVRGLENLDGIYGGVIFASNHTSEFDPFFVPASFPFLSRFYPVFYTSREKSFYVNSGWRRHFYGGLFFKAWGSYPVYVGLHDYKASMKHQLRILGDGGSLCIFPEGKITPDGTIQPAKGGVAYLAFTASKPIVPVYYSDTYRISLADMLLGRRKPSISFGRPMYAADLLGSRSGFVPSVDDFKSYANAVMAKIVELKLENGL